MPLPSIAKYGAKKCSAKSKRTGLPCNNPAAHGCKTCRMHGAHKSRHVVHGVNSGKYINGQFTKDAKEQTKKSIVKLRYLEDIGHHFKIMHGSKTRGPKPSGYKNLDLNDEKCLEKVIAIINKK